MADNSTLIAWSAFSALAGAILTQVSTGLFAYLSDKRKSKLELNKAYREKQVEVAERFYYVTGESMTVLKKSIEHWKDRTKSRSEASVAFFNKEMKRLDGYMESLNTENWKHTLVSLYFNVSLSYNKLIEANNKSHLLYLRLLDLTDSIKNATGNDKDKLIGRYYEGVFDLCSQYDDIYKMLEHDMQSVKSALLNSFEIKS